MLLKGAPADTVMTEFESCVWIGPALEMLSNLLLWTPLKAVMCHLPSQQGYIFLLELLESDDFALAKVLYSFYTHRIFDWVCCGQPIHFRLLEKAVRWIHTWKNACLLCKGDYNATVLIMAHDENVTPVLFMYLHNIWCNYEYDFCERQSNKLLWNVSL